MECRTSYAKQRILNLYYIRHNNGIEIDHHSGWLKLWMNKAEGDIAMDRQKMMKATLAVLLDEFEVGDDAPDDVLKVWDHPFKLIAKDTLLMTIEFDDKKQKVTVKCNETMARVLTKQFPGKFFEKFAQQWQKAELEDNLQMIHERYGLSAQDVEEGDCGLGDRATPYINDEEYQEELQEELYKAQNSLLNEYPWRPKVVGVAFAPWEHEAAAALLEEKRARGPKGQGRGRG